METMRLKINGMSCQSCVSHTKKALEKVSGVRSASVNLDSAEALVHHEGADPTALVQSVTEEGYEATLVR
jgi:Cu+-exporting ATPase